MEITRTMKAFIRILKQPIALVIVIAVGISILYQLVSNYYEESSRQITVSAEQVQILKESFTKTWNRAPTESELSAQIENFVKDEVFYRQAVDLGLDKSDPAVKRRLRQVVELMLDDYANVYPSEDQLRQYLDQNPDKFRLDPRISFRHEYFAQADRQQAVDLLTRLNEGSIDQETIRSSMLMIPSEFDDQSKSEIERTFGMEFTTSLFELEPGEWQGPVMSAYGWHLVKISQVTPGKVPDLDQIWDQVEREWSFARKQELKDEQYQRMKQKYQVEVENVEPKI